MVRVLRTASMDTCTNSPRPRLRDTLRTARTRNPASAAHAVARAHNSLRGDERETTGLRELLEDSRHLLPLSTSAAALFRSCAKSR